MREQTAGTGCPPRPASDRDLDFVRRPMVRWLDPRQLLDTVVRVLASGFLSSFTDNRELQAMWPAEVYDRSGAAEMWLDYVSDLGDGWNPTYTVARMIATDKLELARPDAHGSGHVTERGRILVLGGDLVYPVPKRKEYEDRFLGPYRAALPCLPDGQARAEVLAIPGTHDWYDGLANFTSLFCRGRSLGVWATVQSRSYFAVSLPHGWWLWGVDLQFGEYLDEGQYQYFVRAGEHLRPGDRVVLCMSKEVVTGRNSSDVASDRVLPRLEAEVIEPASAQVVLYLKSGRHFYSRYEHQDGGRHLVTAGGGGAFLHPTHQLPERAGPYGGDESPYVVRATYPSPATSRRLRKRVFLLPAYNLRLAGLFGAVQVVLAFMLSLHREGNHLGLGFRDLASALWDSPTAFAMIALMIITFAAMVRFAHDAQGLARLLIGLGHSSLQFIGIAAVMVVASAAAGQAGSGAPSVAAFLGAILVLGGIGSVLGFVGYLWATNCLGFHGNEAFAPLHHMDHKCFLRLHIDADGGLTAYPVGIDRVGRRWRFTPHARPSDPWLEPADGEPAAHLVEEPIRLAPRPGGGARS